MRELLDLAVVGDVRGTGLMACVECTLDEDGRELSTWEQDIGRRVDAHCQANGLLVRPIANISVMSPPLIISKPQIDELVDGLRNGIEHAVADMTGRGAAN